MALMQRGGSVPSGGLPSAPSRLGPRKKMTAADLDAKQQDFWAEFMKRPDAKAAYAAQRRLLEKKRRWLEERQRIEERAEHRKEVADALEEAPAETKKLIAPIFHLRIVEDYLWEVLDDSVKNKRNFVDRLRNDPKVYAELLNYRENFQAGGEARIEDMEKQLQAINQARLLEDERKKELKPAPIDIHTLKELLEYAQQCKYEGNEKFREGLYEEALFIYSQGDEAMKRWTVDGKNLKNEHKWLTDNRLACLKNKSQAALRLELFQTALEAADAALAIDCEDHKAWYRKLQAEKGLGKFKEAEASLARLEDVAQWCPDRQRIMHDCDLERKRLKIAKARHKADTQEMLGKAFDAGVFSLDRERELEEASKALEAPQQRMAPKIDDRTAKKLAAPKAMEEPKPLERNIRLTAALAGDLMDELAEAYAQKWFQARVRKCARDSGFERSVFLMRLKDVAFEVQKPVLEKWGFEGTEQGVREMTAAIRDHAGDGHDLPEWLKAKQDRCLELLYGGKESGMLDILTQ
mmetsp:Transcript_75997/g.220732  ORF Transcript_75997/g.220732 Transcript_75997/m.220732 type:complete len:522 (-) Transcript_75997:78-1643(-)